MDSILDSLTQLIRHRRSELGISQRQLAQLAGVHAVTIAKLETGALSNVRFATIERLSGALGLPLSLRYDATSLGASPKNSTKRRPRANTPTQGGDR